MKNFLLYLFLLFSCAGMSQDYLYLFHAGGVSIIDPNTNTVIGTVGEGLDLAFSEVAKISPDMNDIYVINSSLNSALRAFSVPDHEIAQTVVGVGNNPSGLALSPDGTKAYVTTQSPGNLREVSLATLTVSANILLEENVFSVDVHPSSNFLYVVKLENQGKLLVIDAETFDEITSIDFEEPTYRVNFHPSGNFAYLSTNSDLSYVIDPESHTVTQTLPFGTFDVEWDVPNGLAYVISSSAEVSVVNTADHSVVETYVDFISGASGLALSNEGLLYIANQNTGFVTVINPNDGSVVTVIEAVPGFQPKDILSRNNPLAVERLSEVPDRDLRIKQNYPNPFTDLTFIDYSVPSSGWVRLEIFDAAGKLLDTPVDHFQPAGNYRYTLDGKKLIPGVYFIRLVSGEKMSTLKMVNQ